MAGKREAFQPTSSEETIIMAGSVDDDEAAVVSSSTFQIPIIPPSSATAPHHGRPPHNWVVQVIFLLLGIGILAPWNAFISAKDYFDKRLCHQTTESSSDDSINNDLESKFAFIYTLASVVSLGFLILIQTVKDRSNRRRRSSSSSNNNNVVDGDDDDDDRLARTLSGTRDADREAIMDHDTEQDGIMRMAVANDDDHHPNAEPAKGEHSFFMVMLPLALYLVAFLGQAWMVRIIEMPWFLTLTFLGLAVCGMSCGIAQAGIVATAGLFPSDLAMNPYMAVRTCRTRVVVRLQWLSLALTVP
jgi:hypothetical protein